LAVVILVGWIWTALSGSTSINNIRKNSNTIPITIPTDPSTTIKRKSSNTA
jgi:hypothetical protein